MSATAPASGTSTPSRYGPGLWLMGVVALIYAVLAIFRHSEVFIWDEGRYWKYALHLLDGYYVTDQNPDFVNGPGYPILLMPFAAWKQLLAARLLNALLMAGCAGFVWLTVRRYAGQGWGLVAAAFCSLHPTLVWMSFAIMTEPLAMFCLSGFVWSYCLALSATEKAARWIVVAAVFFGWLTLTRVFFGHVLMATAAVCLPLLLWRAWRVQVRRTLLILAGAFVICVPYLIHTWQKTGQVLCWSTNSGELLYWMTSHQEGENGHWFSTQDAQESEHLEDAHFRVYTQILKLPVLQREAAFKELAKQNLKEAPAEVAYNWVCNLSRLAFGFPRSHQPEELRTVVLIGTNGPFLLAALLALPLGLWFWRRLPVEVILLQIPMLFYVGGSSLAPALPRYFILISPIVWVAVALIFKQLVRIQLRPQRAD